MRKRRSLVFIESKTIPCFTMDIYVNVAFIAAALKGVLLLLIIPIANTSFSSHIFILSVFASSSTRLQEDVLMMVALDVWSSSGAEGWGSLYVCVAVLIAGPLALYRSC